MNGCGDSNNIGDDDVIDVNNDSDGRGDNADW